VERNRKAGQNPPRVVAPIEEEEEEEEEEEAPTVISVSIYAELRNQLMTKGDTFYMNNWIRQMCLTDNQHVL